MSFVAIGGFIVEYAGTIALASAAVGAVSSISAADAGRRAAHTNADIARQRATIATDQANVNEEAQRRRAGMALGREAAGMAESGTGLDGSNADVFEQSATNAELDALNIRYAGKLGKISNDDQAAFSDMQARDAMSAGWLNAGAAVLSSAGSYARGRAKIPSYGLDGG